MITTKYLSTIQVLAIHDLMIKKFGGSHGLRDIGLLESAIGRRQATFDSNDLNVSVFEKAAALLQSLLKNHPFIDGNKRTALSSAGVFLKLNGYQLTNSHNDEVDFTVQVDNKHLSIEEIIEWLRGHTVKI